MIGYLRKSFPASVTSETVKRYGLASKNESYVINVLQFLGLIDEKGKRTEEGHEVMTKHDEVDFQEAFKDLITKAYSDLFELRGPDAWTMNKDQLITYFRSADKTSDIIGGRQAGVFIALRELVGFGSGEGEAAPKTSTARPRPVTKKPKPAATATETVKEDTPTPPLKAQKGDMALTVRIEINLPADGTQETYDAIFKSIKANLYPS
jgi:hypothetical protein